VPFGGQVPRRRATLVSWLALAVALGGIVTYAFQAEGYQAHRTELNDGGIWVTSNHDGSYGRINKPIGELDGTVFSRLDSHLDVVQDGASVVGVNLSDGVIIPIDPSQMAPPDGEEAAIPGSPALGMAGGSLAVLDTASGDLWVTREDPQAGVPSVTVLSAQGDPVASVGKDAALAVSLGGTVYAVSAVTDRLTRLSQAGADRFAAPAVEDLPQPVGDSVALTTVGETPVVLDTATGALSVIGGAEAAVPAHSVLQQPGPASDEVLVASTQGLLAVNLASGSIATLADGVDGDPANPVRLGACRYGAWAGGTGAVVTDCGDGEAEVLALDAQTTDLVFRTNRGQIVLNDRASGHVWDIDSDRPTQLDNWDAFRLKAKDENSDDDDQHQNRGDRRPPKAKNDNLGARPGRTTILHPLDNDTAPSGRLLAIRSVRAVSGVDAQPVISPDGQTVQITLPETATGTTTFEYFIDDGRQSVSAHATVRVAIVASGAANAEPELREGFEPRLWVVPATGTIDVPVLPDWRDPKNGDPVSAVSARAVSGPGTGPAGGTEVRITADGEVRLRAPAEGGLVKVEYGVTDGLGRAVTADLDIRVQDPTDLEPVAPVAEPDVIAGETSKPITITPLANDLPGADPLNPDAVLTLAGKVGQVPGAEVTTNVAKGTITLRSQTAQTYFLEYQAAYGDAETSTARIRVDVRAPENPPLDPVAVPDSVTLFGQAASLVDVLANDVDPSGGLLSVQRADGLAANQLDVAVVAGRWLRISARQGKLTPNPQIVRYTISNGLRSGIPGQVVVNQRPTPPDQTPVTQNDEASVRSGESVAISVLDNDFSPSGGTLTLQSDGQGARAGTLDVQPVGARTEAGVGAAYVAGRTVRYVSPEVDSTQRFTIRYQVANEHGETATGKARVTVFPVRRQDNQPPEPPVIEGRTVSGDTVKLRLPGSGVDPDGDAVTIVGLQSAPTLGRVTRIGANSIEYTAYPDSVGTDEFTYSVIDTLGATATGTARVAIAPPAPPQPPLAVADAFTVEPGRTAVVDVLANDLVPAGSRVTVSLVDPPDGVRLRSETGPVEVAVPTDLRGRSLEVVYRITDGLQSSQSRLTVRTAQPFNNPPVVSDAFGAAGVGDTVTADVLSAGTSSTGSSTGAYDPDGPAEELRVTRVYAPSGVAAHVEGETITVQRTDHPMVVPFRVEDADGGSATASLYVPAADAGVPYVKPSALIRLKPGQRQTVDLADYVVNPSGGPIDFTLKSRVWSSPRPQLNAEVTGEGQLRVSASSEYAGPGAVVMEVTTGVTVDDPDATTAIVSVPVQVGQTRPILRCPQEPLEVPQAETVQVDLGAVCHVWTADPAAVGGLDYTASFEEGSDPDLSVGLPSEGAVPVTASAASRPGDQGRLLVTAANSEPAHVSFVVVKTPPPSLAPIRVSTLRAGESQTIDLAPYLTPGVSDPVPTVLEAEQVTDLGVGITTSGSSVTIRADAKAHGHAEFRVVMSDVAGSSAADRRVEGRIALDILGVPDAPGAPVPGNKTLDSRVSLDWSVPASNGAPIDYYEVRDQFGHTTRCATSSCDITGLVNGTTYFFTVRAHNAVGFSDWSAKSRGAMADDPVDLVGKIRLVEAGDGYLHIRWKPVYTKSGAEVQYRITWNGGVRTSLTSDVTITGLDNHQVYIFNVVPVNAFSVGGGITSDKLQPVGTPATPAAPTITDQETPGSAGAITLSWPEVDANGPTPVRYTVNRDGSPLPNCTNILAVTCTVSGMAYDGKQYNFTVQATNRGKKQSGIGAASIWKAVGKPASWGSWSLEPTGNNNQAKAKFEVPNSRGDSSIVRIYADGAKVDQVSDKGALERSFTVANNLTAHSVYLEVCNEKGACSQSSVQSVQTYGPIVPGLIHAVNKNVSGRDVSWTIEVDTNGDPATLIVTSDLNRTEQFDLGVGVQTIKTQTMQFPYSTTENVTITLTDASPNRGTATVHDFATTVPAPPPTMTITNGQACNDTPGSPLPRCNTGSVPGADCTDESCAFVNITLSNFTQGGIMCSFNASGFLYGPFSGNGQWATTFYFGQPGHTVSATCANGVESATAPPITW